MSIKLAVTMKEKNLYTINGFWELVKGFLLFAVLVYGINGSVSGAPLGLLWQWGAMRLLLIPICWMPVWFPEKYGNYRSLIMCAKFLDFSVFLSSIIILKMTAIEGRFSNDFLTFLLSFGMVLDLVAVFGLWLSGRSVKTGNREEEL